MGKCLCQARAGECGPSEAPRGLLSPFVHPLISLSSFWKPPDARVELGPRLTLHRRGLGVCCSDRPDLLSVHVVHFASP